MKHKILNRKGETLIETVVSCAIFGILIVAVTTMIMSSLDVSNKARYIYEGDANVAEYFDGGGDMATPPTATTLTTTNTGDMVITFENGLKLDADVTYTVADPGAGYDLKKFSANIVNKIEM